MGWWTACEQRTLTEEVAASPAEVRRFYVDLSNLKVVHPLVISVRPVTRHETAQGYTQTYRIQDRIPLRFGTLRTGYSARLDVPADGDVTAEARQFPRVRLHSTVTFELLDEGTRVTERLRIEAPRLLAAVTTREAVKAHIAMLAGIRRHFESVG